jgi:hypothetical protein
MILIAWIQKDEISSDMFDKNPSSEFEAFLDTRMRARAIQELWPLDYRGDP